MSAVEMEVNQGRGIGNEKKGGRVPRRRYEKIQIALSLVESLFKCCTANKPWQRAARKSYLTHNTSTESEDSQM